ncbi:hypothetical protein ACLOAV_010827 [Pseudogymnoascus australis]
MIEDIVSGIRAVQPSEVISVSDTLSLVTPIKDLKTSAQNLLDAYKVQLETVEMAKGCGATRSQLSMISNNGNILIDLIVSKIPSAVQSIVKQQADQISKILKDANDSFAEGLCRCLN